MISFVKWSGSKRSQAKNIAAEIKQSGGFSTYYEPFLGSGAIYGELSPTNSICSDIYKPLIDLWLKVQLNPSYVSDKYEENWTNLQKNGYTYFYDVRSRFNAAPNPDDLLFLSRTCVNGLIRFNSKGEFNNSLHHTRKGMEPKRLREIVSAWSSISQGTLFKDGDYWEVTDSAKRGDLIYLDPPYFNNKDRYLENIDHLRFFDYLEALNRKSVKFVLSYDGQSESKVYEHVIPSELYKRKLLLHSGLSAFRKTQDKKKDLVHESLYLNF